MGRGDHPKTLLPLVLFYVVKHSFMLKSYWVGGWLLVAHKILFSAPVSFWPFGFDVVLVLGVGLGQGGRRLGLGLDNKSLLNCVLS